MRHAGPQPPTRGIDSGLTGDVYDMRRELMGPGTAVLVVPSEITELLKWCHRIPVMRDGRIMAHQRNEHTTEDTLMHAAKRDSW